MSLYLQKNKYLLLVIFTTLASRFIYHTNTPFFEDEGLFLLDSSKNIFNIYTDTLYMKPYIGNLYYGLIYHLGGANSFLVLHLSTTLFIIISNIFIYLIVQQKTKNEFISIISTILFLTFTNLLVGGYGHSSLEHFQLIFLLSAYYFLFIQNKTNTGLVALSFAIMVKQNAALALVSLAKIIYKNWKFSIILFFSWLFLTVTFFENFFFNTLIFPSKYYPVHDLFYKVWAFINFYLKVGYGFNFFILVSFFIGSFWFYKSYKNEYFFIIFLGISLLSTPLYPQHFVAIVPFLIIVASLFFNKIYTYKKLKIYIMGGVVLLLIFNALKLYKNYAFVSDEYSLTRTQTTNGRLDGRTEGLKEFYYYLKELKNEKVFIYPILAPHFYILNDLRTIEQLFSNDHFETIIKHDFLRNKLLNSIDKSKPKYLIEMKKSDFDSYIQTKLNSEYMLHSEFSAIKVYKLMEKK